MAFTQNFKIVEDWNRFLHFKDYHPYVQIFFTFMKFIFPVIKISMAFFLHSYRLEMIFKLP